MAILIKGNRAITDDREWDLDFQPSSGSLDIGTSDNRWRKLHLSSDADIDGGANIEGVILGQNNIIGEANLDINGTINTDASYKINGQHQQIQLGRGGSAVTVTLDGSNPALFAEQPKGIVFAKHDEGAATQSYDVTGLNYATCSSMSRAMGHRLGGAAHCVRSNGEDNGGAWGYVMDPTATTWYCSSTGFNSGGGQAGNGHSVPFPAWGDVAHAEIGTSDNGNTMSIFGSGGDDRVDVSCMAW